MTVGKGTYNSKGVKQTGARVARGESGPSTPGKRIPDSAKGHGMKGAKVQRGS